jgi:deoxyribodipyrimidine photo-lyase
LSELIWRVFYANSLISLSDIILNRPDGIQWRNNEADFKRWCSGTTGYPMVDAMRRLNETGYMHNRRLSFYAHLLINWQWGGPILPKNYWIMKWR